MRSATLPSLMFVVFGYAASAQQLSVLPQIGKEISRTTMKYNNLPSFSPLGLQAAPRLGARLDYQFKQGHGPFLGVATSRSIVAVNLSEPQNGMNIIKTSNGNLRFHLEGGYQMKTKPIYFGKAGSQNKSVDATPKSSVKKGCGYYRSLSGRSSNAAKVSKSKDQRWYMSVQPAVGAAFTAPANRDLAELPGNPATYQYKAGNWNSAIITGAGFEFGKDAERKFTISVNYFKGIGNLGTRIISTTTEGKTSLTQVSSKVSGWNLSAGIPITLVKKKSAVSQKATETYKKPEVYNKPASKCGQYTYRCGKAI